MCGILGMPVETDLAEFDRSLRLLAHRGPDQTKTKQWSGYLLGHQRLSIIDIEGGTQPMCDPEGRGCIVYNGEVYNYRELAQKCPSLKTWSDTEIALQLGLENQDFSWLGELDGMFALALVTPGELLLARDLLGVKPLYVGERKGMLSFSSEIKALLAVADTISEFPPGHVFTSSRGMTPFRRITAGAANAELSEEVLVMRLRTLLGETVKSRLVADVPVGVFLSGGLDSSLIAALAERTLPELHTFAVGMPGAPDLKAAREAADFLGSVHHARVFTFSQALEVLPQVIYHLESFDFALVRSAIANYFLAELARKEVKVALSGEGADELFAGYHYLQNLSGDALGEELLKITLNLHYTNLQRCDRMSMAHGLEVRVPFLDDLRVVDFAMSLPAGVKIRERDNTGKWILRRASEAFLPQSIVWRRKQKFAEGAGLADQLRLHFEREISDEEFLRSAREFPEVRLRNKEELAYFQLFLKHYPPPKVLHLVGRTRGV